MGIFYENSRENGQYIRRSNPEKVRQRIRERREKRKAELQAERARRRQEWEDRKNGRGGKEREQREDDPSNNRVAYNQFVTADYQDGSDMPEREKDPGARGRGAIIVGWGNGSNYLDSMKGGSEPFNDSIWEQFKDGEVKWGDWTF